MFLRFIGGLMWSVAAWPFKHKGKHKGKSNRQINRSCWEFQPDGRVKFRDLGRRRPTNARRGFESAS
jgi:hypothetical protein